MQLAPRREKLLIIENEHEWGNNVRKILFNIGEKRDIEVLSENDLYERYASSNSFEDVGECFTDLELGMGESAEAGDRNGLEKVLPYVRSKAPWIPVACLSRWIIGDPHIIGELSAADFDFFAPKNIIWFKGRTDPEFNASKWQRILRAVRMKRIAALSGRLLLDLDLRLRSPPKVIRAGVIDSVLRVLDVPAATFDEGLVLTGIDGSEFTLDPIAPGFSGVNVSRLIVSGHDGDEPINSHWLIKWGRPVLKVFQEATAHRRALTRGMPRNLQVPQLFPQAMCWGGLGFLVYAFEHEALTAFDYLKKNNALSIAEPFAKICSSLYSNSRRKPVNFKSQITKWCGETETSAIAHINFPPNVSEVTWALLHGDLHLRNIFLQAQGPTLIDFARSDYGPVAIDCAKLIIDTLVFGLAPSEAKPKSLTWQDLESSALRPVVSAFAPKMAEPGDKLLCEIAMKCIGSKYQPFQGGYRMLRK